MGRIGLFMGFVIIFFAVVIAATLVFGGEDDSSKTGILVEESLAQVTIFEDEETGVTLFHIGEDFDAIQREGHFPTFSIEELEDKMITSGIRRSIWKEGGIVLYQETIRISGLNGSAAVELKYP